MRRCLFLLLAVSGYCYGQYDEFKIYPNGLIYDESTMHKLGVIVDSLNIKFRLCDLSHPYYSYVQGIAYQVDDPSPAARKMIQAGATFEDFKKNYPQKIKQLWVLKTRYSDYNDVKYIEYSGLPSGHGEPSIRVKDNKSNDKIAGWISSEDGTMSFYLDNLSQQELPFGDARLVQYVDCMIDTTAQIYFPKAKGTIHQRVEENSKAQKFISSAEKFPNKPKYPEIEKIKKEDIESTYNSYSATYETWDSLRLINLDEKMKSSRYQRDLLAEAAADALSTGESDARLEFYVARYLSKETALQLMRSRRVVGNCSQDQSPRFHAINICRLSAETAKWDIFLRSHLDVMNDHFQRRSDGSYAWAGRKTYLKELEELDIRAVDLLLGTSLRVGNVGDNHYFGSVSRIGRALADVSDKDALETRLIGMMQDEKLDPYNRLLIAYLFDNYSFNLDDEQRKKVNKIKFKTSFNTMPPYVQQVWKDEE